MLVPESSESFYLTCAKSYFKYSNSTYTIDGIYVYEVYNGTNILRYPAEVPSIDKNVYLKDFHFTFWNAISKYLPYGSYISNGFVSPENQAKIGLKMLEENYSSLDLSTLQDTYTNPELVGQYNSYNLYQFNYTTVQEYLSQKSITWAKPNCSVHQRGLAIDIKFVSAYYNEVVEILNWEMTNNSSDLNLSGVFIKISDSEIHIEFSSDVLSSDLVGNSFLHENKFSSPVNTILSNKTDRFYEILKANGHVNLDETGMNMSGIPLKARKQNTALAKAIKEILEDCLSGPSGIITNYVQGELEYLSSLVNGLLGASKAVNEEMDRITDGRASSLFREALLSEINKTPQSNFIKTKLTSLLSITSDNNSVFNVAEDKTTYTTKYSTKSTLITTANTNISYKTKDTKDTTDATESGYDSLRTKNLTSSVDLKYDHFSDITNTVDNYTISNSQVIEIINQKTITETLALSSVTDMYAYNLDGVRVIGTYSVSDGVITITFNNYFTGTITLV